jgi:ribosomal protein S18 acetylase RimI-like enzyme
MTESPDVTENTSKILLGLGAIVSYIVALRLSWLHIQRRRRLSQQTYAPLLGIGIRTAVEKDIPLIRDLTYKIWPQTYESILSKPQIDYMLNMMYSEQSLLDQMQKQGHEFVIVNDGKVGVGFASFSMTEPDIWKLHKIYILPGEQGKGVGKYVIDQVAIAIMRRGAKALQLNVNRNNNAKDFYEKLGFVVLRSEDIDIGSGYYMNDYIMEKKLATGN